MVFTYNVIQLVAGHGPSYDWCFLYDDELPETLTISHTHGKPLSHYIKMEGLMIDPVVLEISDPRDSSENDTDVSFFRL